MSASPNTDRDFPNGVLRLAELSAKFYPALAELLQAYDYAVSVDRSPWEFAVSLCQMHSFRMTESDARWLICRNYVSHSTEITRPEDSSRTFRRSENLYLSKRACLVLTEQGAAVVRALLRGEAQTYAMVRSATIEVPQTERGVPLWDGERHELLWNGKLVKRFKCVAVNQETILSVFQEEGWPQRIDDPLPPHDELDAKRRLHDAIKCLNRNQKHRLLHFRGDGSGEGVLWEPASPITSR